MAILFTGKAEPSAALMRARLVGVPTCVSIWFGSDDHKPCSALNLQVRPAEAALNEIGFVFADDKARFNDGRFRVTT